MARKTKDIKAIKRAIWRAIVADADRRNTELWKTEGRDIGYKYVPHKDRFKLGVPFIKIIDDKCPFAIEIDKRLEKHFMDFFKSEEIQKELENYGHE